MPVAARETKLSRLNYLCEREWVVYTIEEELGKLERLNPAREAFSEEELNALRQSLIRLNRFLSNLESDADDKPLPHWSQRKSPGTPASDIDGNDKSSATA